MILILPKLKNKIRTICIFFVVIIYLIMTTSFGNNVLAITKDNSDFTYKVIILNSYHKGFTWTDDQTAGIISKLNASNTQFDISVEYLDWKRYPTNENLENNYAALKYKYSTQHIDLIFTTDDAALKFALENRSKLFSNAPIVFSGVNQNGINSITKGYSNFTGISEDIDPKNTIDLSLKILPTLKNVYLIFDNTESGKSTGELVMNTIENSFKNLNVIPLNNYSHDDIINLSKSMGKKSIFLLTTYYVDNNGSSINFEAFNKALYESSTVPIFHVYNFGLKNGSIGGSMINAQEQGNQAASLALKILGGTTASSIKIITQPTQKQILDYKIAKHYGITLDNISSNIQIINEPFSFIKTYKSLVYSTLTIIALLIVFIISLVSYSTRIRKLKKNLEKNNEDLTALYEELAATDEEIKAQYDELMETRDDLISSQERYSLVLDSTSVGIWDWDMNSNKLFFSDVWYEMIGYDRDEFLNEFTNWEDLIFPDDLASMRESRDTHIRLKTKYFENDFRLKHKDNHYIWIHSRGIALFDKNDRPYRMTGSHMDISKIKIYQNLLQENAYHDSLTGLNNRLFLYENIGEHLSSLNPNECFEAMFFIDTDNFKFVNDSLGHYIGDKLLIQFAKRLSEIENNDSIIFRLSGDEFIFFLKNGKSRENIESQAKLIINLFQKPFIIDENIINISISIGISIFPIDGDNLEVLLRNADIAMYKVKERGRNGYYFYSDLDNEEILAKVNIEKHLKNALSNDEFQVYYQPQIHTKDTTVYGFEALVRWINPTLGFIPPSTFINVAEETGVIVGLGQWVLKNACIYIKNLNTNRNTNYKIAVNISVIQLLQDNFLDMVFSILNETKLDPSLLELEITESIILDSPDLILNKLNILIENNICIALDDFGTGYSSLAYLKNIPFSTLKIDKLFIDDLAYDNSNTSLTDTIISLGHKLGLTIIAEGVETNEQLKYLEQNGCDIIQGYYFSKPLPPSTLEIWLDGYNN